ncbi:MAG: ATP-binding protein [archaeon]
MGIKEIDVEKKIRKALEKSNEIERIKNEIINSNEDNIIIQISYDKIMDAGPKVIKWVNNNPYRSFELLKEMIEEIVKKISVDKYPSFEIDISNLPYYNGKIGKLFVNNIKSKHIHSLISTEGVANHVGQPVPLLSEKAFSCKECGDTHKFERENRYDNFKIPNKCPKENCEGELKREPTKDEFIDEQIFELQEKPERSQQGSPPQITVITKEGNVNKAQALRHLEVRGFLKIVPKNQKKEIYDYYIEATGIDIKGERYEEINLKEEDIEMCKEITENDDNLLRNLSESLCPYFYGKEYLKIGLLLQQVRGQKTKMKFGGDSTIIGDQIHILWLGDPGTRKSVTAKQIAEISPAGIFSSCENATKAATTAYAEKDSETSEWKLVAGALPRAHKGFAALDELDKAEKDIFDGIREAMSTGEITVHSGSIHETLPADVCVLITLNPKRGRLTEGEKPKDQLPAKFEASLMNRIDLPFVSKDKPDIQEDNNKAKYLLSTMKKEEGVEEDNTKKKPKYNPSTLRKFIAWARQREVEMSQEAIDYLSNFYVKMRKQRDTPGMPVPIGLRQVSSIMKLSVAITKVKGEDVVSKENAEEGIELLKQALKQWDIDLDSNMADIDMFSSGPSSSERQSMKIAEQFVEKNGGEEKREEIISYLGKNGEDDPEKIIRKLKENGILLEKGDGKLKIP